MDKISSAHSASPRPFFKLHLSDVSAGDGAEEKSTAVSSLRSTAYIASIDSPTYLCNHLQDNRNYFCERYDKQHQTLTKHLAGATHQEKADHSKPCIEPDDPDNLLLDTNDSDERDLGSCSPPFVTSVIHSGIANPTGNKYKTKEEAAESADLLSCVKVSLVSGKAKLKEFIFHSKENFCTESEKSEEKDESSISDEPQNYGSNNKVTATQCPFEGKSQEKPHCPSEGKSQEKPLLGNKIIENLNLAVQEMLAHSSRDHAKDLIKCFLSYCLDIGLITTAHQLSDDLAGLDDNLQDLMKSLHPQEKVELEREKHEHEEQEKISGLSNPLKMTWPGRQAFDKSVAMELAQNLSQHNCLTNETLAYIYRYYKEQTVSGLQSPVSSVTSNSQDNGESLSNHNKNREFSLKEDMFPKVSFGAELESDSTNISDEHQMSEVLIEDALHLQPMENSFYFPTSLGSLPTSSLRRVEDLHLVQRTECMKTVLLSVICTLLLPDLEKPRDRQAGLISKQSKMPCTWFANGTGRGEREVKNEKEDSPDFLGRGNAEVMEQEKEFSSDQVVDPERGREDEWREKETDFVEKDKIKDMETEKELYLDSVVDTAVLEKSDFEENEKAGVPVNLLNPNSIKDFGRCTYLQDGGFEREDSGAFDRKRMRKTRKKHVNKNIHSQLHTQKNETNKMTRGNHGKKRKLRLNDENIISQQLLPVMCQLEQTSLVPSIQDEDTTNPAFQSTCLLMFMQETLRQINGVDNSTLVDTCKIISGMKKSCLTKVQVISVLFHTNSKKLQRRHYPKLKKSSYSRPGRIIIPKIRVSLLGKNLSYTEQSYTKVKSEMEGAPATREETSHLPKHERIDIEGVVAVMMMTSDSQQSQSGGSAIGDNPGGASSGHSWGGARLKSGRNSGGDGKRQDKDDDDGDDDKRPSRRFAPDSLLLVPDVTPVGSPRGKGSMPIRNYKRHRQKRHGAITNEQMCFCLGQAGLGIHALRQSHGVQELDLCLLLCLHDTSKVASPSSDFLSCCMCAILHSLLTHFTQSTHSLEECSMCSQLATLVHFHIEECHSGMRDRERKEDLSQNVCHKMQEAGLFTCDDETVSSGKAYIKLRKYLSAALGPVFLLDVNEEGSKDGRLKAGQKEDICSLPTVDDLQYLPSFSATFTSERLPSQSLERHVKSGTASPLTSTTSITVANPVMHKSPQSGLQRRRPSSRVVPQRTIPEESPSLQDFASSSATHVTEEPNLVEPTLFPPRVPETPDEQEDIMVYIRRYEQKETVLKRQIAEDPSARVYGPDGTVSMPEPRSRHILADQNLSVEMQPTGVPGIGEVVYGTRQHLMLVAKNWLQERDERKATRKHRYQHREEGVILHAFKEQLRILHTRYQKHQQWERLVHLGNGVTGKCHLCIDRTSNFKFCCKKMHILQYEDQELEIWSELSHSNLVCFYGAVRHGEKIYLFAEFIDGGSLAALIKQQWAIGRRLSHWTVLNYFRQLLQVLTYLQSMGILHEDIKADNVLVRNGTTEIVLADFGAAQRIPNDHTPPNRHPTGSPAHWSPEKAASEGHGFPSDLWASACVLIHMLSGSPPWISRYPDAAILNFIIWSKPPPMDDVPANVKESVRDLIACCLEKDKTIRPTAKQILGHPAFHLLDQSGSFFSNFTHSADPASHQLNSACLHAHQAVLKDETSTANSNSIHCGQLSTAGTTQVQVFKPLTTTQAQVSMSSAIPLDQMRPEVETGHDYLSRESIYFSGQSSEPQALQASLHAEEPSPWEPFEHKPESHVKRSTLQHRSAPSTSPFLSTKRSSEQSDIMKRKGLMVRTPNSSMLSDLTVLQKSEERTAVRSIQENSSSTDVSSSPGCTTSVQNEQRGSSMKSASSALLPCKHQKGNSCSQTASHSLSSLSMSTPKSQGLLLHSKSADLLMLEPLPDMPSPVLAGLTTVEKSDNSFPVLQQYDQTTPADMLQIPSAKILSSDGNFGRETIPASSLRLAEDPSCLSSYGSPTASTMLRMEQSSAMEQLCAVNVSPRLDGTQTGDNHPSHFNALSSFIHSSAIDSITQSDPDMEWISFTKTPTPEHQMSIPPPDRSIPVSHHSHPHITCTSVCASCKLASLGQTLQTDLLCQENIDRSHASHLPKMLSMINEIEECTSLSSVQINSSTESDDDTILNFIQDQFLAGISGNQDSFLVEAGNKPKLEPYLAPPGLTSIRDELFKRENWFSFGIPKFDQLLQSLADSSTSLKSGRNMSSGEMTCQHAQSLFSCTVPSVSCVKDAMSEGCVPTGQQPNSGMLKTSHKSISCHSSIDEPDQTLSRCSSVARMAATANMTQPIPAGHLTQENTSEDQVSSGDMFGSGPGPDNNPRFLEAFMCSQTQKGCISEQQQDLLNYDHCSPSSQHQQPALSSSAFAQPVSPHLSRKNPNLRLTVTSFVSQTSELPSVGNEQSEGIQISTESQQNQVLRTEALPLNGGVSPLTASPLLNEVKLNDTRPRSRNESGSSVSTPKSSTFDIQEQAWTAFQLHEPGLDMLLTEDHTGSQYSTASSYDIASQEHAKESTVDHEESSMLSILQEEINEDKIGGHRLVFTDPKGVKLFDMRVLGQNKFWKELAATFRGQIDEKAGFTHYTLTQPDGQTPVDFLSAYDPSISLVKVMELSEEHDNISSVCWCVKHLVY